MQSAFLFTLELSVLLHLFGVAIRILLSYFGYKILQFNFIIQNMLSGNTNLNLKQAMFVFRCCFPQLKARFISYIALRDLSLLFR
jgi:hypothetical protein